MPPLFITFAMTTLLAYGNINQPYPFERIPRDYLTEKLQRLPACANWKVNQRHRCRWVAHFLLWELLKISSKSTALLPQIYYSQNNRPQFPCAEVDFNITHSGDWVAVILSCVEQRNIAQQRAVGIDIEYPEKTRDYASLLAYYAPLTEQQWFSSQANAEAAFYRTWCIREAVLKSQGVGIIKLSEVQHQPNEKQIQSAYCPQGQLIFTDQLPFYLAFFVNHNRILETQYLHWNGEQLENHSLVSYDLYTVNG